MQALERRPPSFFLMGAIVTGFAGLVLLTLPMLRQGIGGDLVGILVVIGATFAWGAGTLLLSHRPVGARSPRDGWLAAAAPARWGFSLLALAVNEPAPVPTPAAWGAWAYLVVFGSILAFTSYITAPQAAAHLDRHDLHLRQPCDRRLPRLDRALRTRHTDNDGRYGS